MAAWPELDELKQVLDVTSDDWDGDGEYDESTRLTRLLQAAIDHTKELIAGSVDLYDGLYLEPKTKHAQLALRIGELLASRPVAEVGLDPTVRRLLYGQRRAFGVA